MRSFRRGAFLCAAVVVCACVLHAGAALPAWVQTVVGGSPIEAALFRMMEVPGMSVLYPRPPAEAVQGLNELVKKIPADVQLYVLRAHAEEESLDFVAAEKDWKAAVAHAQDVADAEMQLADFYHRRLRPKDEVDALLRAASAASPASERFESAEKQRAWMAFERVMEVVKDALAACRGVECHLELSNGRQTSASALMIFCQSLGRLRILRSSRTRATLPPH